MTMCPLWVVVNRTLEADSARPRYICTERGVGYQFGVAVEIVY